VRRTHTNRDPLIYAATSPQTDVFYDMLITNICALVIIYS